MFDNKILMLFVHVWDTSYVVHAHVQLHQLATVMYTTVMYITEGNGMSFRKELRGIFRRFFVFNAM